MAVDPENLPDVDDTFGGLHQYALDLTPGGLRGPYGKAWQTALGLLLDALCAAARDAGEQRMISRASHAALARIGDSCGLERHPGEDAEVYRARLANRWVDYGRAGTKAGLLAALAAAGYTNAAIYERQTLPGIFEITDGPSFWVHLPKPNKWRADDGVWGSAGTWGESDAWADPVGPDREILRRIVKKWKPAGVKCKGIVIGLAGETWGEAEALGLTWAGMEARFTGQGWPQSQTEVIRVR